MYPVAEHPVADLFEGTAFAPPGLPARDIDALAGFGEESQRGYQTLLARPADAERFCAWRGHSGRRYVTSIYGFGDCPDYEHVVALAVKRETDGTRSVVAGVDLGAFPIVALNGETMQTARAAGANEIHLHLLAETAVGRAAAIEDLI